MYLKTNRLGAVPPFWQGLLCESEKIRKKSKLF